MSAPVVRVQRLGNEGEPVVVIDHVAPDPHALIEQACAASLAPPVSNYPGLRAPVDPGYRAQVAPLLAGAARHVFGFTHRLVFDRALFSLTITPARELSLAQRLPHVDDLHAGKLAVVHYLGHDDLGGTRFFRHRSTGFETIDPDRHRAYLDALAADVHRHGDPPPGYPPAHGPFFDAIGEVAPRFNRAVVYRSRLLHCAAIDDLRVLPANPATGRLTIASFLTAS